MQDTTEKLFASALALPSGERDFFLMRACDGDDAQLARIQSLLADSARSAEFMNEADATVRLSDGTDRIDNYRLIQELGEGGCGTVYLAEQIAPIRREVAIKIIKLGMDTKAVVARFEAERQALALMDHPHIAKVLDAGATQQGRPYFVMEVVRGVKITEYCDQCRLTIQERLDLFSQLCQAIQHAHSKGVIHRDIKPSNVLVTLSDGLPSVKVIDFGIAKAMHGRLTDQTVHTLGEQFIGTPAYVSPEQIQRAGAISAASDVYSLGALLYELLTGRTPFDSAELIQASFEEARARISEETPLKPSARVATFAAEERQRINHQRRSTSLRSFLVGDLDWITLKCLEKVQTARYCSAQELAADIGRFQRGEPIEARPPSAMYSARLFAARHRAAFVVGLLVVSALVLGAGISTWQALRATRAEKLSQRAIESLVDMFALADPYGTNGRKVDAHGILDLARVTVHERLDAYPQAQARLFETLGQVLRRRGHIKESLALLEDAVRLHKENEHGERPALCSALIELAVALRVHGDLKRADETLREAELLIHRLNLSSTPVHARFLNVRAGISLEFAGSPAASLENLNRSIELTRRLSGPESLAMADSLDQLATTYSWMDEMEMAESYAREALAIRSKHLDAGHPDRILSEKTLAEILISTSRYEEAIPILLRAAEKLQAIFGADSPELAQIHSALALAAKDEGNFSAAEQHAREALRILLPLKLARGAEVAYVRQTLAYALFAREQFESAEVELNRAERDFAELLPSDHPHFAFIDYLRAEIRLRSNRISEAEQLLRTAVDRTKRSFAIPWRIARAESALGEALYRQGQKEEGERYILSSYAFMHDARGVDMFARNRARERVIDLYKEQKRGAELDDFLAKYPDSHQGVPIQVVSDREHIAPPDTGRRPILSSSVTVREPNSPVER